MTNLNPQSFQIRRSSPPSYPKPYHQLCTYSSPSLSSSSTARPTMASISLKTFVGLRQSSSDTYNSGHVFPVKHLPAQPASRGLRIVAGKFSPKVTGRNLRVAVVGGGPAGGSAAETLAKGGIETFLIERKLDNCKPCGGAIPLCMVGEFDLPLDIIALTH